MSERLAAAETALKAGRRDEAIGHIEAALAQSSTQPPGVFRVLVAQLYQAQRFADGLAWAERGLAQHRRDVELLNLKGVLLRRLGRQEEALAPLDEASRLAPKNDAPLVNKANILIDLKRFEAAAELLNRLLRQNPKNPELQRQLGRALAGQGKTEAALARYRQAVALRRDFLDAWMDMAGLLNEHHRTQECQEVLDRALAANPGVEKLLEAKAVVMRRGGQYRTAVAYLLDLMAERPDTAWVHYQIGISYGEFDRAAGNPHLQKAVALAPDNIEYIVALIESLERTRSGDEGANIEAAYQIAREALARGVTVTDPGHKKVLFEVFVRVCDFEAMRTLGDFKALGRLWAESGRHAALSKQIPNVRSLEDRYELVEEHRIWAAAVERRAAEQPLQRRRTRGSDGRIRLGLMSSDLRQHPVGYFALPLFQDIDPRFDLYCYSWYQGETADRTQELMASRAKAFRWAREIGPREAAQLIADDELDMLIELGGTTHMNKLEVMAWKPAPKQASWLGYPHSAGLSTIDYLVVDPYVMPPKADLLVEQPLMLPNAWYPLGASAFRAEPAADPVPPVAKNGYVTFGTANNPAKYTPEGIAAWARIMTAHPTSRFLFVRPEGGTPAFRDHLRAEFERHGVAGERIDFEAVRGAHLPHYNRIDITLDCFPQTGGTTTCEALWMGALCVTLVGEALFERLSYSVLMNLGLGDLCAHTVDEYVDIAVRLAADPTRIAELRAGMRARMQASPLGRTQEWALDFYGAVAKTLGA